MIIPAPTPVVIETVLAGIMDGTSAFAQWVKSNEARRGSRGRRSRRCGRDPQPASRRVSRSWASYSWSSVCQFAGTRPAGPGVGWSSGCEWGGGSVGPAKNSPER